MSSWVGTAVRSSALTSGSTTILWVRPHLLTLQVHLYLLHPILVKRTSGSGPRQPSTAVACVAQAHHMTMNHISDITTVRGSTRMCHSHGPQPSMAPRAVAFGTHTRALGWRASRRPCPNRFELRRPRRRETGIWTSLLRDPRDLLRWSISEATH